MPGSLTCVPVATLGIRGTDYTARLCSGDCGGSANQGNEEDGLYIGVSVGGVWVKNDAGNLDIDKNEYGFVAKAPAGWSTGAETGGGLTLARRSEAVSSIRQFGVKAIFVETSVNPAVIREIAREAGVKVGGKLYSDSMGKPGSAGETYIGMMRENVLTIVRELR